MEGGMRVRLFTSLSRSVEILLGYGVVYEKCLALQEGSVHNVRDFSMTHRIFYVHGK